MRTRIAIAAALSALSVLARLRADGRARRRSPACEGQGVYLSALGTRLAR